MADKIIVDGDLNIPDDGEDTVVYDREVVVKGDLNL